MKYVYVVWGSEDGNVGVFSSFRKALKRAEEYITQSGQEIEPPDADEIKKRKSGHATVYQKDANQYHSNVTLFTLNL